MIETASHLRVVEVTKVDQNINVDDLNTKFVLDNSLTNRLLGNEFTPLHDTVVDIFKSFVERVFM